MLRGAFWEFVRIFGWIPLTLLKLFIGVFAVACLFEVRDNIYAGNTLNMLPWLAGAVVLGLLLGAVVWFHNWLRYSA
ncbi:MAG: hypothetical protein ACJ8AI_24965 [Rhodopila sp.]|jgi:hypothetical protein